MATHEIPFTRNDLLQQLVGHGGELREYFAKAIWEQRENLEMGTTDEVMEAMAGNPDCFFHVPDYLASSLRAATDSDTPGLALLAFQVVELIGWNREYIIAHINLDGQEKADTRTKGQVAFEAYDESRGGVNHQGDATPGWDFLGDGIREGWEAAARAVCS